jgi:hypothetical protein
MTEREVIQTIHLDDGTEYRAVIQHDPNPEEPYNDGGWPILRLTWSDSQGRWRAEEFNHQARPYVDKFNESTNRAGYKGGYATETFERYLRIFHGNTLTHSYGPNQGTDYTYFAFDTEEWRDRMGLAAPPLSHETPLNEIRAWIEGDVWGIGVEERYNPDEGLEPDEGWDETEEGMTWGYYGAKYATEEAKELFALTIKNHTTVHRYPEHEKIDPVQGQINAIMEFLETSDDMKLGKWVGSTFVEVAPRDHQKIVFEHFGIDYGRIGAERELMFKRLIEGQARD